MAITWIEINPAAPTSGTIAGRRDTPVTDSAEAGAAAVQFIFSGANSYSLNHRIENELARLESQAASSIPDGSNDGVLAKVMITTTTESWTGVSASSFRGISLVGPPYHFSDPSSGIRLDRRTPQMWDTPTGTPSSRYFWGIRV
jgi:hypothetical protein